jgi:hypothetical protein
VKPRGMGPCGAWFNRNAAIVPLSDSSNGMHAGLGALALRKVGGGGGAACRPKKAPLEEKRSFNTVGALQV